MGIGEFFSLDLCDLCVKVFGLGDGVWGYFWIFYVGEIMFDF